MRHFLAATAALGSLLFAAGCSKENDTKAGEPCPTPVADLASASGLPAAFPAVAGVHFTGTRAAGPSTIVEGYTNAGIPNAFGAFTAALARDPYHVTKSEQDAHDAEVNFASDSNTGQVRLGEACRGRTSVAITVRPT